MVAYTKPQQRKKEERLTYKESKTKHIDVSKISFYNNGQTGKFALQTK